MNKNDVVMDPIFRPARVSDINEIAKLIHISGQIPSGGSLFEILFGLNEEKTIHLLRQLLIAKTPSWLHYSVFYIAEIENQVVSIACGYLEPEHGIELMITALIECGWKERDFAVFKETGAIFDRVRPKPENDVWILEFVATHPDHRRKGLTQILLHILLRKGKNRGLNRGQIGFFSNNLLAQKIYEKVGFHEEKTLKDPEFKKYFNAEGFITLFCKL